MADQTARLEAATVRAEVGSSILYRFSNDGASEDPIPTASGDITNLKKVILDIQTEGANKISFATQIYATTAAGIAATSNGAIFLVRSIDPDEIYAVYSNNAGTAVDTGKRALSATAVQAATDAASDAAASAQAAAATATARVAGFHSPSATDPTSRDDGSALQIGDTYFNTVAQTNKVFSTTGWVIASVSGVDLNAALATREPTLPTGSAGQYLDGTKTFQALNKAAVGLSNVDNTSDLAKPLSTAATTALNLKAPLASPTFTGTVGGITKSMVGLAAVDNTSDAAKPVSTAQQAALDTKQGLSANLTALAGLVGLSDRLAYFTAAGTMALATLTAQGRTFLAAGTAALQRTALGLGNVAVRDSRALASEKAPSGTPPLWDDGYVWGFETGITAQTGNGNKFNYFRLSILDDEAVQASGVNGASGSKVNGLNVQHIFGGPSARGGRHAGEFNLLQGYGGGGATSTVNEDRNYVGVQGQVITMTGDTGTSTADTRGAYFGISSSASVQGEGRYVANLTACEFNTYIAAGYETTRVAYHSGIQICSDLRQRGFNIDAAISISNLGGTVYGWKYGMFLHGGNGRHPLDADSTLIKVESWGGGMNYGIDLRGHSFTNAVLATDKTAIGDGSILLAAAAANVTVGLTTTSSQPSFRIRSGGGASYDAGISAIGGSATVGSGILILEGANVAINGTLTRPSADNTQALGSTSFRFTQVSAVTGTINTSDEREKNILGDLPYGLDVLQKLRTIEYTWKDGGGDLETVEAGYDEIEEVETEEYSEPHTVIDIVDGKAVRRVEERIGTRPIVDTYPLYDESGERVIEEYEEPALGEVMLDENGKPVLGKDGNEVRETIKVKFTREASFQKPRMKTVRVPRYEQLAVPRTGKRKHFGLSAQQVKSVIDEMGIGDFAGWTIEDPENPDSRQGLRYDQFIPLLINAITELNARVIALESKKK